MSGGTVAPMGVSLLVSRARDDDISADRNVFAIYADVEASPTE